MTSSYWTRIRQWIDTHQGPLMEGCILSYLLVELGLQWIAQKLRWPPSEAYQGNTNGLRYWAH